MQVAGVRCNTVTSQYVSAERIVCDMAEALLPHSPGGPVELCIGVCSADFRTLSTQTYSFVVSLSFLSCRKPSNGELRLSCGFFFSSSSSSFLSPFRPPHSTPLPSSPSSYSIAPPSSLLPPSPPTSPHSPPLLLLLPYSSLFSSSSAPLPPPTSPVFLLLLLLSPPFLLLPLQLLLHLLFFPIPLFPLLLLFLLHHQFPSSPPSSSSSLPLLPLQSPSFARVRPDRGPVSGGTRLTVTGRHLDAGSSVNVFIDKEECLFVKSVSSPLRRRTTGNTTANLL